MKLDVLTTETVHHCYFVDEVQRRYRVEAVLAERGTASPAAFDTAHPFEADRAGYERQVWFGGRRVRLSDLADVAEYRSLNDEYVFFLTHRIPPSYNRAQLAGAIARPRRALRRS